jgi:hypothetical protein
MGVPSTCVSFDILVYCGHSEVANAWALMLIQQYVFRFDVAMNDIS